MHQPSTSTLKYAKMNATNIAGAVDCICEVFLVNEPMASHLQMVEENFKPFIQQLLNHALKAELSWVAYESDSGEIIGAFIATDLADDYQPDNLTDPKLLSVFKFLDKLWAPFVELADVPKGLVAHPYMGAVLPEYQRTGVINTVYQIAYRDAWEKGYRKAMGEITSLYSLNLLRKNPHAQELNTLSYADYNDDGKKIFEGMQVHEQCVLFSMPIEALIPPEVMQFSSTRLKV